jgi:CheY-like chemotaxis protein
VPSDCTLGLLPGKSKSGTLKHRKYLSGQHERGAGPRGEKQNFFVEDFSSNPEAGRLKQMGMATTTVYGSPHPRVRVLIADDHEVMRMGIRNLLQFRSGWSVCAEASNGQEAVDKTLQFHPDVVVMDLTMPVMNGLEAAREIARVLPQIPIILFSLHVCDDLYQDFQKDGIRGAVAKGDAARDLAQAVETVLRGGTFFPTRKAAS